MNSSMGIEGAFWTRFDSSISLALLILIRFLTGVQGGTLPDAEATHSAPEPSRGLLECADMADSLYPDQRGVNGLL